MPERDLRKFLFLYFILGLLIFFVFQWPLKDKAESIHSFSLKLQKFYQNLIKSILPFKEESNPWQEKYFSLLKELGELKLKLSQGQDLSKTVINYQKLEIEVLKDTPFGILYLEKYPEAREGDVVVDQNLMLIGRVKEIGKDFVLVEKITKPGFIFNLIDAEDNFLGTGETSANGFIEIRSPYLSEKPKSKYVFSGGGDGIFPKNLFVGEIIKFSEDALIIRSLAEAYFKVYILRQ